MLPGAVAPAQTVRQGIRCMVDTQQRRAPNRDKRQFRTFQPGARNVFFNPGMDVGNAAGNIEAAYQHVAGLQGCFDTVSANFVDILNTADAETRQGCDIALRDERILLFFPEQRGSPYAVLQETLCGQFPGVGRLRFEVGIICQRGVIWRWKSCNLRSVAGPPPIAAMVTFLNNSPTDGKRVPLPKELRSAQSLAT